MRYFILAVLLFLCSAKMAFCANITKLDDNSVKVSTTLDKTYTYEDLTNRIAVLKGERDRVQSNLDLLNGNIAEWEKLLADAETQGIKAKPIEVKDEATDNKGE